MPDNSIKNIFFTLISEKVQVVLDIDYIPGASSFPFADDQKFNGISVEFKRENINRIKWHDTSVELCFYDELNNAHWFTFDITCLKEMVAPGVCIKFDRPKERIPISFSGNVVSLNVFKIKKEQRQ